MPKYPLEKKLSGIYKHRVLARKKELVRGFDDVFYAPHSRFSEVRREDIEKIPSLQILAESDEAGVYLVIDEEKSNIFLMGHPEYDRMTLDGEYKRDTEKGLSPEVPKNYYEDNNPEIRPDLTWRANGTLLYTNWLNYYVYQTTPYDINDVD